MVTIQAQQVSCSGNQSWSPFRYSRSAAQVTNHGPHDSAKRYTDRAKMMRFQCADLYVHQYLYGASNESHTEGVQNLLIHPFVKIRHTLWILIRSSDDLPVLGSLLSLFYDTIKSLQRKKGPLKWPTKNSHQDALHSLKNGSPYAPLFKCCSKNLDITNARCRRECISCTTYL